MHQRTEIIGFLGSKPELQYTNKGEPVTNFSVATSHKRSNSSGEYVTETTWWRVSAFGKTAENATKYLDKGSKVMIAGRLVSDPSTGGPKVYQKKDGVWAASFDIIASEVVFLSSKGENNAAAEDVWG